MTECGCVSSCLVTLTTVPCDIRMSSVPRFLTDGELRMFRRFTGLSLFSADLTVACFEVSKQTSLLCTLSDTCMTPSKYELLLLLLLTGEMLCRYPVHSSVSIVRLVAHMLLLLTVTILPLLAAQ